MKTINIHEDAIPLILAGRDEAEDLYYFLRDGRRVISVDDIQDQLEAILYGRNNGSAQDGA